MFCQTCGSPNNQSANFCGKCGVSMSNGQSSASDSTNGKQPLSFREYMESRVKLQNEGVELTSIQKRKTNERISQNSTVAQRYNTQTQVEIHKIQVEVHEHKYKYTKHK